MLQKEALSGTRSAASSLSRLFAGRESLARLAAFVSEVNVAGIPADLGRSGPNDLREHLREVVMRICTDRKDVAFLASQGQIKNECWLSDIASLMNAGKKPKTTALLPNPGTLPCADSQEARGELNLSWPR